MLGKQIDSCVRMTMTGNFDFEKEHVREEMQCRLDSLSIEEVLSPSLKEQAMKVGIVPVCPAIQCRFGPVDKVGVERYLQNVAIGYKQGWYGNAAREAHPNELERGLWQ